MANAIGKNPRSAEPSSTAKPRLLICVAVLLSSSLLDWGIVRYGLDTSVNPEFWHHILGRAGGPMTFRFFLQPTMALIASVLAGIADARAGRRLLSSWFRLQDGLEATARIVLLGLAVDLIYPVRVFDHFYPAGAILAAVSLGLAPYLILRPVIHFIAATWIAHSSH